MEIQQVFTESEKINVYNDGTKKSFSRQSAEYGKIFDCWQDTISLSRQMPAFGVSLNDDTVQAMKRGVWLEFEFAETKCVSEMCFDKILVYVMEGYQGINLVRNLNGQGYSGRCYYLDLNGKNMTKMYDLLANL